MPLPKALLLDLDNTVLAFDQAVAQSWAEVSQQFAPRLGADEKSLLQALLRSRDSFWADPVRNQWGRNDPELAHRQIVRAVLEHLGSPQDALADTIARTLTEVFDQLIAPFPGALEALRSAKGGGVRLALVTNGGTEVQRRKISRFGLDALVDAVLIEGELGYGKPDARVFRLALERLGAAPSEAWMVGDNLEHDVAPAQALGMRGVWVDWAGKGLPVGSGVRPDRTVREIRELV